MSFIISQMPVNRLPSELVQNAAFVKQVDFDPVHESKPSGSPAAKIHGDAAELETSRFDTVSISAEAFAAARELTPARTDGMASIPADTAAAASGRSAPVVDITDHAKAAESQKRNALYSSLMKSWNAMIGQLKQESEGKNYDYFKTVKRFREGCAAWEKELQSSDPEAFRFWREQIQDPAGN